MNNLRLRLNAEAVNLDIKVPINLTWDLDGVNDSIDIFESEIIRQVINPIDDFETTRYSHKPYLESIERLTKTSTNYEFYFYSATTDSNITGETTSNNWVTDYRANGISTIDVLFKKKVFTNCFFKLDFYDTKNSNNQQIYLTIILPTSQGKKKQIRYGINEVEINKPVFELDFVGDKEGYYIYWLKDTEFVDLNKLYMTAKFYDANIGQFKRMMTESQGLMANKFDFNNADYFYHEVNLDYSDYTYDVYLTNPTTTNQRVGTTDTPIKWFEYVNPPVPPAPTGLPTPTPTPTPTYKKFSLERCSDGKIMYGTDNNNLGIIVGDFVKIAGGSNVGCWEVTDEVTTGSAGASIVSKHKDCSCS